MLLNLLDMFNSNDPSSSTPSSSSSSSSSNNYQLKLQQQQEHGETSSSSSNGDPEEDEEIIDITHQQFHNTVRENIIFLLFFLTLTCLSSWVIEYLHQSSSNSNSSSSSPPRPTSSSPPHHHNGTPTTSQQLPPRARKQSGQSISPNNKKVPSTPSTTSSPSLKHKLINNDDDESVVKRICSWLCTLTLSTSIQATLLLPISIISNEVLLIYPTNKYLEWLNGMLIQGLWNLVFLFSNIGLFVLLPFAHLFIEAEGFSGKKQGLASKLHETIVVLALISFTVWGIAVIVNSLFRGTTVLFHFNQLPFIYSCISFFGVLVFTICTPLGLSRLFTILSDNFVFVPEFLRNLENEHVCAVLECENLKNQQKRNKNLVLHKGTSELNSTSSNSSSSIDESIQKLEGVISRLETLRTTPPWKRNLLYPGLFACVLAVTGLTVFIVLINAIKIVAGFRDLSLEVVAKETLPLGRSSLSFLGPSGAFFEIILVMYLITTCHVGLYSLPVFRGIVPVPHGTHTSHLISNCAVVLVLSSALPVFMRILGLTNFDLLGTYAGKIDWIENTLIVVFVNLLFTVLTCVCIINKVTRKISNEIIRCFRGVFFFKTD